MTDITPRVGAPLLAASQAQKHVTHNEALYQFDAFVCARFIDRTHTAPPSSPADGDTYLVATGGSGTWLGQDGNVAYCADGAWRFYPAFAGLIAYVTAESKLIVWSGSAWVDLASMIATQDLPMVGVNTTADSTNKLAVQSNAVLFSDVATGSGGTGDIRATLSKQASANTASFLFQDAFSGRAEIGLTGDDNFHFKVSPDGSAWTDAMDIAASTGVVTLASSVLTTADINGGTMDGATIGGATPAPGSFSKLQVNGTAGYQVFIVGSGSYSYDLLVETSKNTTAAIMVPDATTPATGNATSNACLWVRKDNSTSRSINAAGTVNASGADYAEYETKAAGCGAIAKGQIVGFDENGLLTDKWANAISFGIKSTAPSYVGGDIWGT